MAQLLLLLITSSNWMVAHVFHRLTDLLTRVYDPPVTYRLNGRSLRLPLSHALPWVRRGTPLYFDNLRRLASFLRERHGALCIIDVGANIGDSYAMSSPSPGDAFLLVEGSPRFFSFLERNTRGDSAAVLVQAFLSDRRERIDLELVEDRGNATLRPGGVRKAPLVLETLDAVLDKHPTFRASRLLKVDTEGYDRRVLLGAHGFLTETKPVIFFEHQPRDLMRAGEDELAVFHDLASMGYCNLLFYDHRGHLVAAVPGGDPPCLENLMRYARHQEHFYFDVVAFSDRDPQEAADFLASERRFFDSLEG